MGSRIADIVIVNTSFTKCSLRDDPQVQLVSASGHVLISGIPASTSAATHGFYPLATLKTEVADGNYCGPAYKKPVTLAFVLSGAAGRVVVIRSCRPTPPACRPATAHRDRPDTSRCTHGTRRSD